MRFIPAFISKAVEKSGEMFFFSVKAEYDPQQAMMGDRLMSERSMMGGATQQTGYDRYANPSAVPTPVRGPTSGSSMNMMGSGRDGYQAQMQQQMPQQQQRNISPMGSMTPVGNTLIVRNVSIQR